VLRYGVALLPNDGEPVARTAHPLVDELSLPMLTTWATGGGSRPARASALAVEGAEVSAVLRDDDGHLVVRLFDPTGGGGPVRLDGWRGVRVDLRGTELGPFDGELVLGPWEIATLRLDEPA